ncbi:CG4998 [Drosophila busckii]|uniref:Phenoloxidase-activating factor 2 n=2 Tax=Drosophila busckii TaxID=30019 RepID=A0A0M4EHB8_DROBS|nr:CG4998 [Drosophila busckii]
MLGKRSADAKPEEVQGRYAVHESSSTQSNSTEIDTVIDQLINSRREGRNLGEYDAVYADGNIDVALQEGNDLQARNLIREKLCGLGLMSCDVEEKRPYYSTIYAQGPPPSSGFGGGPYGPAKPMPPPGYFGGRPPMGPPPSSLNSFGPPRKVGYEGPYKPMSGPYRPGGQFGGSFLDGPPPSAIDGSDGITYNKPPPGALIYDSKPPGPIYTGGSNGPVFNAGSNGPVYNGGNGGVPPYSFENPEKPQGANGFYSQQSSSSSSSATSSSNKVVVGAPLDALQQHVHHHYHHVEGGEGAHVPSVSVPIGGGQSINTDFSALAQSSATYTPQAQASNTGFTQSNAFNAGFNSASQGGLLSQGYNPNQKPSGGSLGSFGGSSGLSQSSSSFGQQGFGASPSSSYHSQNPDYYKKELQSGANGYNGLSTGYNGQNQAGQFQGGYDTSRQQIVDCQCVPISQCPAADRIGRKEDLILPIDPRNLGKDIEALSDDASNSTTKATAEKKADTEEEKKRTRRQAEAEKKQDDDTGDLSLDAQGRQGTLGQSPLAFPALQALELIQRKVLPTYGVSFGLPFPAAGHAGGYPANVLNDYYPAANPHFGSIGPNGLNLGLLNVNPLVSLQVSKTDYGEKVVKPLVNLHVTPNENIIQKVGSFFKRKPAELHATHYHHHDHFSGFEHDHHDYHDHHEHHPEHYHSFEHAHVPHFESSAPGPHYSVEMHPSTPIFEYHSGPSYEPADHHPHHYSEANNFEHSYNSVYPEAASAADFGPSGGHSYGGFNDYEPQLERSSNISSPDWSSPSRRGKQLNLHNIPAQAPGAAEGSDFVSFPHDRRRRSIKDEQEFELNAQQRAYYGNRPVEKTCRINEVCCRRPLRPQAPPQQLGRCGTRNAAGITGRIKNPVYVDGDSEFGEYPWHVAILKKDPKESIYACGGTLIDAQHIISAAHCIKSQNGFDLRVRLGEWDVNHDVEFFPYIERDVVSVHIHPEYYAGTLDNDLAILKLDQPVDFTKNPHISPACLPDQYSDFTNARCWTTGWGKDAFGEHGKYQNILKEVDVPILSHHQCESQLRNTRLGYSYKLNPGFICAGGEEGKDACKGDGGGPLVCERNGYWNVVGVVSWGIGCGQVNVPGVYVKVSAYLPWIQQITQSYK